MQWGPPLAQSTGKLLRILTCVTCGIADAQSPPFGQTLSQHIVVPFPVESSLSQVGQKNVQRMWYRRQFAVPADWAGQRILLHFGAVDYEAKVYVNQHLLTTHTGGYNKFFVDMTDALASSGLNELVLGVWDPTDKGPLIPIGKQRSESAVSL